MRPAPVTGVLREAVFSAPPPAATLSPGRAIMVAADSSCAMRCRKAAGAPG
ncbi:hypothetical protein [Paracoccus mutanolyticus]|uniref:hypothetical protein n=1 Tax=Paracoccus mutanolyticus TaxID=1499308 RepID=UPI001671FD84|nr:hypothetical protein [Paracoccus mutanolyticus]